MAFSSDRQCDHFVPYEALHSQEPQPSISSSTILPAKWFAGSIHRLGGFSE